ncbi:xylulose kinase-1 [Tanacetum coccineum]
MANLKYSDKHNMVAFLKKPNESVGFTEVVDFLKGTSLRYALTHNPTIYDSLVKQFWQTATVRTLANGTQQLVASIDSKEYTITEASVRSKLQLADATGIHNLSDAEIYAGLATLGYVTEGDIVPLLPAMLAGAAVDQGEESEDQGRKFQDIDDDPLVSLVRESMKEKSTNFVTPTKALGEAQEEEISPTILETAKTLSKIDTGLDAEEEINTGREEINTGIEEVSTGSTKVDSGTANKRGQREGKAPMVEEDIQATHKTKEQMRQEEVGLEEAINYKGKRTRYGGELQTKTSKKQRIDDKDVPAIGEKVAEVKEEEQVKRTGKRKKQKARKGINVDKSAQEDSEESVEAMNPTPLTTKFDCVANGRIFRRSRNVYQYCTKALATPEQTATGKEISNPLIADSLLKTIRYDNGTEFKNSVMNQFYEMKDIKREFNVARTPQQNGVAERRNRTLIEAARKFEIKLMGFAGTRDNIVTGQAEKKTEPKQEYILIPICTSDLLILTRDPRSSEEDAERRLLNDVNGASE